MAAFPAGVLGGGLFLTVHAFKGTILRTSAGHLMNRREVPYVEGSQVTVSQLSSPWSHLGDGETHFHLTSSEIAGGGAWPSFPLEQQQHHGLGHLCCRGLQCPGLCASPVPCCVGRGPLGYLPSRWGPLAHP